MRARDLAEQLLAAPAAEARRLLIEQQDALIDDELAGALKSLADEYLRSDVGRSLLAAEMLQLTSSLTGSPSHQALALLAEANARAIGIGEYEAALELYDEAAGIYRNLGRPADEARAQVAKVWPLSTLGRHHEALETGRWASQTLEAHGEWLSLAKLTSNLAALHGRQGEDSQALELFDRACELYRQLGIEGAPFLARAEQNRAIVLRNLGRFEASVEASRTAWGLLEGLGQRAEAGRAQQNLAFTYFVLGRYNEALELLDRARDVFLSDGRQFDALVVELNVSDCLLHLRRFEDVLQRCRAIRHQAACMGIRLEAGQAMLNEASAHAGLESYERALGILSEAQELFEAEGHRVLAATALLEKARILQHLGQFEASRQAGHEAATVFDENQLPVKGAQARLVSARAASALGEVLAARNLVASALAVGEEKGIPWLTYQGHHLLGCLESKTGHPSAALAEYDRAILAIERLRGWLMVEYRPAFVEDKQAVYEDATLLCVALGRPLESLQYVERAKSRVLVDLLAYRVDLGLRARSGEDRELVQELVKLREQRDRLYRRWEGMSQFHLAGSPRASLDGDDADETQRQVLSLESQITERWHKLLVRNADYARDAALWQVRVEPVQPYLSHGTLLLEYFAARGQLLAFLVSGKEVHVERLPASLDHVGRLTQLFWLNLNAVRHTAADRLPALTRNASGLLQQLHEALLAPLAGRLADSSHLVIVPHGALHYLPFHALFDGGSYLLERHEISYLPVASLMRYCLESETADEGMAAFGHSFGSRLPHAIEEARSVAALFAGRAYLEEEATRAHLEEAAGSQILHLAAHGSFRPDQPLFAGLALADGWLTTLDVFDLHLRASLVTLSACETGRSVLGGGDELLGLMRAFLYAGAATLVLTLWAVEDRSTAELMNSFYRRLADGWAKGTALRDAQKQLIREGRPYSHPYFWAPFFLVGDPRPLQRAGGTLRRTTSGRKCNLRGGVLPRRWSG